jgi:glutaredoxin-like YruB-family protein
VNVKVYTTPTCGYCHQAKNFLNSRGIKFTEIDVSRDQAAAREMVQQTGQMGVPVIVVDGQAVVGFDRARLERLLAGTGNGRRLSFGLSIADASSIAQKAGSTPVFGAYIGRVAPSSPGEKAGLRTGDIVTEVNLRPIHNAGDLESVLSSLVAGNRVAIAFLRSNSTLRAEIVL